MSEHLEAKLLHEAMQYGSYGWRVLPAQPGSKRPILSAWQEQASCNEEQIVQWWTQTPLANIGVQLGSKSGIIDLEGDGQKANEMIMLLFNKDPIITPMFRSSRGMHRIFKYRSGLPHADKNGFHIGPDLELRTGCGNKGAQSIFPPSIHESGIQYEWVVRPDEVDVAELPDHIVELLWRFGETSEELAAAKNNPEWNAIKKGVSKGQRNEAAAKYAGLIIGKLADPWVSSNQEMAYETLEMWNERNQPPLSEAELRTVFDSILRRHLGGVAKDSDPKAVREDKIAGTKASWAMEIIKSDPRQYRIYSPLWSDRTPAGYVEVGLNDLQKPARIRTCVLNQADVYLTGAFDREWTGDAKNPSLGRRLTEAATHIEAGPDSTRLSVVAERLSDAIAYPLRSDDTTLASEAPTRLPDGSVAFRFQKVWEAAHLGADKVTRPELCKLLDILDASDKRIIVNGRNLRLKMIAPSGIERLRKMIGSSNSELTYIESGEVSKMVAKPVAESAD